MKPENCKFFANCSASMCPLDPAFKNKVWLSGETETEEICRNPDFSKMQFIITQRKIKKALKKSNRERDDYFTYEMLDRDIIVKSGIRGIPLDPPDTVKNSEKWYNSKQRKWIINHPIKKQISGEEIKRRADHMRMIRKTYSFIGFRETLESKGVINPSNQSITQKQRQKQVSEK